MPSSYEQKLAYYLKPLEFKKSIILQDVFDFQQFHKINEQFRSNPIYNSILSTFDILFTNPKWEKDDFNGFGFWEWSPLNHIYSVNKIEEGKPHSSIINDYGKYIVRLYHSNQWRSITVDDNMPIDIFDKILMPHNLDENGVIQLWPILLTKAILKINRMKQENEQLPEVAIEIEKKDCPCEKNSKRIAMDTNNYFGSLDPITLFTSYDGIHYSLSGLDKSRKWNTILNVFKQMKNNELLIIEITDKNQGGRKLIAQVMDIRYYPLIKPKCKGNLLILSF